MTEYELMYVVPASFTDEEAGKAEQAVAGMLAKAHATPANTTRIGKLRLAYPIKRQTHGHYVLVRFSAEPPALAELNNLLRLSPDTVLRHLILRADEAGDEKYDLVPFQPVNVEERGERSRRPRPPKEAKAPVTADDRKAQKEGVAVLEGDKKSTGDVVAPLSSEALEKKIDAALEEKA